ncbi:MAG: translational GTPase TypA [Alphaproteobacteria bacterium]
MSIRNIAIIAHVDHGKTTLVDALFRQSGTVRANQNMADRVMDSNDLERERGITILAKCTSVPWKSTKINIVDTPGHQDFGGEVERVLRMVDGVLLLVDAAEGPMPQTKFVTSKALALGLRPVVVINKVDRSDARPHEVVNEVFDLFALLDASEEQLDFPVLFAAARDGWASATPEQPTDNLHALFDLILDHVPEPEVQPDAPFAMLVTMLDADPYLGRVLTGRVEAGTLHVNEQIKALHGGDGKIVERARVTKLLAFHGTERRPVETAEAGDIVAVAGLVDATVADTLCVPEVSQPIVAPLIDPPTLAMTFSINDSPLAGRDGDKVTSRLIRARLMREAEGNVAIKVSETPEGDAYEVAGRGELQLGVLVETMRREGFELSVSRPRVLFRNNPTTGQREEPIEEVVIDVDDEHSGIVVEKMATRRGEMTEMRPSGGGKTRISFLAPARGLIGYHGEFLTDTRGTGIMHRLFHSYGPFRGPISARRHGVMISNASGPAVAYALWNLEERGRMLIEPGAQVYPGMVIGEHAKGNDLEVNPLKGKQLTNIRAAGKDEAVKLTTPMRLGLEETLAYINDDELVEVTPKHLRIRKQLLDPHERKRARRAAADG